MYFPNNPAECKILALEKISHLEKIQAKMIKKIITNRILRRWWFYKHPVIKIIPVTIKITWKVPKNKIIFLIQLDQAVIYLHLVTDTIFKVQKSKNNFRIMKIYLKVKFLTMKMIYLIKFPVLINNNSYLIRNKSNLECKIHL
jgi:hypothetical protein